ncbi:T-cell surface glycoprotein CD3 epsilon chain-like [Plectropomus leopardus]|uniref:T-cell surface glycoprotein CD3 epsilon chain-like n=1 Tax=Plectropomus leopardus TaxID=160734 RepID=UPI001C4ABA82|nr:T-cell surface glycoprotein CD3 epsilon chain-like [Plectropomus leopardus]
MVVRAALAVLAVLLLFIAKAGAAGVEFWREKFTMTCPENGTWFRKQADTKHVGPTYTLQYGGTTKGLYYCEYPDPDSDTGKTKYYFYVKGKVCKSCFELDSILFLLVVFVDVLGTAAVMIFIFRCTKKKSSAGPSQSSTAPALSERRGPSATSTQSPYESLSPHTRSQDPYSTVNRMG